jgi:hypothetical protein
MKLARFSAVAVATFLALGSAAGAAIPLPPPILAPIAAATSAGAGVSVSEEAFVPKGQIHDDDLVVVLGDARVDGEVTGSIVVVMGSLELSGHAHQDVVSVMSRTHLAPSAQVDGQLVSVGWSVVRDEGSKIDGQVVNVNFMNLVPFAGHGGGISGFLRFLYILHLIKLAFLFVVLVIITALMPRRLATIAAAFPSKWGWAFLVGLLVYTGVVLGAIFLFVTLIGIPLALVLWYAAKVMKWIGLAAIFYLMGQTMGRNLFKRELPHLASVLGGFVLFAAASLIPILGWVLTMILSIMSLGIVLVTRFGAEPAASPAPSAPLTATSPGSIPPAPAAPGAAQNATTGAV